MENLIYDLSNAAKFIIYVPLVVLFFFGDIWLFVKLNTLDKMSKRFLASSKRENFEGGVELNKKVRSLFAAALFLDVFAPFFLFQYVASLLRINGEILFLIFILILVLHIVIGLPIIVRGNKAANMFMHLYPKNEVYIKKYSGKPDENGGESFFEVAEVSPQPQSSEHDPDPDPLPEETKAEGGELIEYDDEGYAGAWRLEKSDTEQEHEQRQQEEAEKKECSFCGTLNGVDNKVCDFCGADISEQGE